MMRIYIADSGLELVVELAAKGSYSPDVMDDLASRALDTYRHACATKMAIADTVVVAEDEQ